MFRAMIFDMDGVIIDSEPINLKVDNFVLEKCGFNPEGIKLDRFVGMTNPEMWTIIKVELKLKESISEILDMHSEAKIHLLNESNERPIDGIAELLNLLKQNGILIALASSASRQFIDAVLDKFDMQSYFTVKVSGEEVKNGKPAPDIFLQTANDLGVKIEDCLVIEDSKNGVSASISAGIKCVGYQNINSGEQDLSKANLVVHSIKSLDFPTIVSLFNN